MRSMPLLGEGERDAIHIARGSGKSVWLFGDLYTIKLGSEDTGGAFALWDTTVRPGSGPPPHVHHAEDESFYVVEGQFEFQAGGRTMRAKEGSFVYVPRGTAHSFKNVGKKTGRAVTFVTPGGFETFFEEAGQPATDLSTPPAEPGDLAMILGIAKKHHCEILANP